MPSINEPLVTVTLLAAMLLFDLNLGQFRFLLPSVPELFHRTCTSMEGMEFKQRLLFLFNHRNKGHLAVDMLALLWKGILLEGCNGSRQFAFMIFTLFFACNGLLIMTATVLQILNVAELHPSTCGAGLSGLHFALIFILSSNHERYRIIMPVQYQSLYIQIVLAYYAVELALVYCLRPGLPFSSLVCGTLAGFLYAYGPWLLRRCSLLFHLNPDGAGLVWSCPVCTLENGVYFHKCEICGTPRPVFG